MTAVLLLDLPLSSDLYPENKIRSCGMEISISPEPSPMATTILQRVAMREASAFEDCVDKYGGLVWSMVRRFTPSHADAEDAAQDVFIEVWQKAEKWDPAKASEVTYITMLARRRLIDRFRKSQRSLVTASLGTESEIHSTATSPLERTELLEESEKATRCIEKLGIQQREVIRRSIHGGESHQSISTQMGIPLGTVKTYARRSLIQLRDCMERLSSVGGAS